MMRLNVEGLRGDAFISGCALRTRVETAASVSISVSAFVRCELRIEFHTAFVRILVDPCDI